MSSDKQTIKRDDLIVIANSQLREHEDFIEGANVLSVAEQHGVITFKGESFLDKDGLPTAKSTIAFNLYKWLCHHFSNKYTLVD
jgi:hypothetical protein